MTPQEAIAVIGTGATTALGWDAPASFAAVRAGVPGFAEHPYLVDSAGDFVVAALAPAAPADTGGADRFGPMIDRAFGEALKPLAAAALGEVTIPCVIGIPRPRPGLPDDLEERIRADLMRPRAGGRPAVDVVCIAGDHAAGLLAIRSCWEWMQRTGSAIGLAGGVDSWISSETIEWLEGMEWLHAQRTPFGFIPGEAAAFCLLASPEAARRLGAVPRLLIRAVAAAAEPVPIGHEGVCVGRGLSHAVQGALSLLPTSERVHDTICDLNGDPYRADEFGFTVTRTSDRFLSATEVLAPADCWGDVGAASGPLFVGLAAAAAERGWARGTNTLVWTSSTGTERAAALLELPRSE